MYQDKITLTREDILNKEFKIDARGYRLQEVDKFLDLIIKDYGAFIEIINVCNKEKKELIEENNKLKYEIRTLKAGMESLKNQSGNEVTNLDILRRLSQLEKIVYGKDES